MVLFHVSAARLKTCTLRSAEGSRRNVTLFPFFDEEGIIRRLMLLVPQAGVYILEAESGVLSLDLRGSLKLEEPLSFCRKISGDRLAVLARLYHYDPWWLLKRPEYSGLSWVPTIKATNCVRALSERDVTMIYFDRRLSRVRRLAKEMEPGMEVQETLPFDPAMLPRKTCRAIPPRRESRVPGWRIKNRWPAWRIGSCRRER